MKTLKALLLVLIIIAGAVAALIKGDLFSDNEQTVQKSDYDKVILFPSDRYPETAKHIKDAIKKDIPAYAPLTETEYISGVSNLLNMCLSKRDTIGMNGRWRFVNRAEIMPP